MICSPSTSSDCEGGDAEAARCLLLIPLMTSWAKVLDFVKSGGVVVAVAASPHPCGNYDYPEKYIKTPWNGRKLSVVPSRQLADIYVTDARLDGPPCSCNSSIWPSATAFTSAASATAFVAAN